MRSQTRYAFLGKERVMYIVLMVCQVSNIAGNSGRIIVSFVTCMTSAERCKLPSFVFKVMLEALCYLQTARFFCFVPFQGDR